MIEFNKLIQAQFDKMCATGKLFRSSVTGREVWRTYLNAFTPVNNPVFRDPESTAHNCNLCNSFIRRYGNIVAIDENYQIMTLFDVEVEGEFKDSANALSMLLKNSKIENVFSETYNELNSLNYEKCKTTNDVFRLGMAKNIKRYTKEEAEKFGVVKANETITFNHMHLDIPKMFINMRLESTESYIAKYRDAKNVFQRAMEEIPLDTLNLVRDLINQESLLDGKTHLFKVEQFIPLKQQFNAMYITSPDQADNWCWVTSYNLPIAKFRNELIGVLCKELAEGEELNKACQSWNKRVDPANYMKAVAPITARQVEVAQKYVEENEYTASFDRRFATMDDIKVSEILHSNVGDGKIKNVSMFDDIKTKSTRHKRNEFDGIEEVSIDKFMADILPGCTSVQALLKNNHQNNLVTLTTSNIADSKPIFKWSNNYSWTFNGNLAGKSQMKEAVKKSGGKVDGVLRFSISWNEDGRSIVDFDAHAIEPSGKHIYFSNYKHPARTPMTGQLDVDMINPPEMGVENITWSDQSKMRDGKYQFFNRNYNNRRNTGFKAEIEFNGELYSYEYVGNAQKDMDVAVVTLENGVFSIEHKLPLVASSSQEMYGLQTEEFHKVNLMCLTPNHWDGNNIGNKHYLFMLEGCKTPVSIRSFHSENLIPELAEHRKVLEVLGTTTMIKPEGNQLSGIGFNATVRDELIVKLEGSFKRVVKIKF